MAHNSITIQNNSINGRKNKIEKTTRLIGGLMIGNYAKRLAETTSQVLINPHLAQRIKNISNGLSEDDICKINTAVKDAFKKTGLEKKGVEIISASHENEDLISEIVMQEANNGVFKFLPKRFKKTLYSQLENTKNNILNGQNALYAAVRKKIVIPEKGLSLPTFHEIGHAINANYSKFGKLLQNCRPLCCLALPISLIALLKDKKQENEKPKNKLDAAGDFIKNNAGKLVFAVGIPMLTEEAMASIKGGKLAKQLLSPDLAKKVSKTNKLGFLTYFATVTLSSIGLALGVKLRDKFVHGDKIQNNKA